MTLPGDDLAEITIRKYLYEDKDRHGNTRLYFRKREGRKFRKVRLREVPGSPEFMEEFAAARDGRPYAGKAHGKKKMALTPPAVAENSLRWLIARYYLESADYKQYDPETQSVRRNILRALCDEPVVEGAADQVGDLPYSIPVEKIEVLRDRKALVSIDSANARVKALRQVYKWAKKATPKRLMTTNPANDVDLLKRANRGGHHTWSIEEILKYIERHPPGTKAFLALALFLMTGQRISDVAKFGKQHIRRPEHVSPELRKVHAGRWLAFRQHKNRNRSPTDLVIPVLPQLDHILRISPCGDMSFLETEHKRPHSTKGLGNWFADRCVEAKVPGRAHGLRKAGATIAAENGATGHQLMAIFGWKKLEQAEVYTKKVRQQRIAGGAMSLITFGQIMNESDPPLEGVGKSGSMAG